MADYIWPQIVSSSSKKTKAILTDTVLLGLIEQDRGMLCQILDPGLKIQSLGIFAIESVNFHVDTLNTTEERRPEESLRLNGGRGGLCLV